MLGAPETGIIVKIFEKPLGNALWVIPTHNYTSSSGRAMQTVHTELLKADHAARAAYYPVLCETTYHTIFLLERLTLLPDVWCPTEVLPVQAPTLLHHPHTLYFHTRCFTFFPKPSPRLQQRLFHSTFTKTPASKSLFSRRISSALKKQLYYKWWWSQWLFYPGDTQRCTQVCVYPLAVLPPLWSLIPLGRAHSGVVFLHNVLLHGAFYKAVLRAFITLMMQSATAHEVAVPSLQAEPPSSTAVQEANSSFTTLRTVQDSHFHPRVSPLSPASGPEQQMTFLLQSNYWVNPMWRYRYKHHSIHLDAEARSAALTGRDAQQ